MSLRVLLRATARSVARRHLTVDTRSVGPAAQSVRLSTTSPQLKDKEEVKLTFVLHSGERIETTAPVGDTLLDVVVNKDLALDGFGACEGTLTCSTCHVILSQKDYDRIPNEPLDEERDMLDLAYSLTDTSRLGCQITLTKELDGLEVRVPETINDARS